MRSCKFQLFPGYLFVLLTSLCRAEPGQISLTIQVSGAAPSTGQVICSLFNSPENYLKQPLINQQQPIDSHGDAVCHFESLAAGTYAASVIYDEDLNGELNIGLLGIPTELIGMSNNAKGLFGPPSFEQTSFSLSQSMTIDIVLDKAKD